MEFMCRLNLTLLFEIAFRFGPCCLPFLHPARIELSSGTQRLHRMVVLSVRVASTAVGATTSDAAATAARGAPKRSMNRIGTRH